MVAHAFDPSTQEGGRGRWIFMSMRPACSTEFQDSPGYTQKTLSYPPQPPKKEQKTQRDKDIKVFPLTSTHREIKYTWIKPDVTTHSCNLCTWKAEAGELRSVLGQPGLSSGDSGNCSRCGTEWAGGNLGGTG